MVDQESAISRQRPSRSPSRRLEPTTVHQSSLDKEIFEIDRQADEFLQALNDATRNFLEALDDAEKMLCGASAEAEVVTIIINPEPRRQPWWRRFI